MAKVEPGQLRRWNKTNDTDFGKLFVLLRKESDEWSSIWNFMQDARVRSYSEETILGWSEVVGD